jgi:RNA polymerase sigma-70 factor (ECF subfamily)
VFRHALRITRIRADAEDATTTVFLEAWRKRSRVRAVDGSILPWLLVTTTNVCRNLQRANRRYRKVLDALPRDTDPDDATGSDHDLVAALQSLPLIDQQLLGLTGEGYSTTEAAEAVGVSPGAARTRISRARQRLRARLDISRPTSRTATAEGKP